MNSHTLKVDSQVRTALAVQLAWETTDDFLSEKRFEVLEDIEEEDIVVGCEYYSRSRTMKVGVDTYQLVILIRGQEIGDCVNEVTGLTETWRKNGKVHRDGGFPAHVVSTQFSDEFMIDSEVGQYFIGGEVLEIHEYF